MSANDGEILILHATCGAGHRSAARALAKAFAAADRSVPVRVLDALDGVTPRFRRFYTGSFEATVEHLPSVYGAFFAITKDLDRSPVFRAARGLTNRLNAEELTATLRASKPRAVVCTHFLPLEVALREKRAGRLDAPIFAVVTDYVAHGFWRQKDADVTFCPPGRAATDLVLGAVPARRIVASGIPIDPVYALPYDQDAAKRRAGLSLTLPSVVLLAGGAGMGPLVTVLRETAERVGHEAEIVVVCGKNEKLRREAEAAAADLATPVRVLGFVDPIVDLLRAADVVVTKPGGLTTSECLALGKAIVFYEAAPGQESANARYAADRDGGIDAGSPSAAAVAAAALVRDPVRRERLGARARKIARPDAARDIAEAVLLFAGLGAELTEVAA
jgi:processive 1,2-diacylglycerol beta-glucosyltransferase